MEIKPKFNIGDGVGWYSTDPSRDRWGKIVKIKFEDEALYYLVELANEERLWQKGESLRAYKI